MFRMEPAPSARNACLYETAYCEALPLAKNQFIDIFVRRHTEFIEAQVR